MGGGPTLHSALTRANETDGLVVDWARLVSERRSGESKSDSIEYEREAEYEAALMLAGIIECQVPVKETPQSLAFKKFSVSAAVLLCLGVSVYS